MVTKLEQIDTVTLVWY